jgi:DNA-directed RNA polymerase subunit E'/Rpb7
MTSPYITTMLETNVVVKPNQLNNRIYKNLKDNLIAKLEGKCYKNYGYINKIYEIKEMSDGVVVAENPTNSAYYIVKFTCKLCNPIKANQIICKIEKINSAFINAQNGPITVIIVMDSIDKNKFVKDGKTGNLLTKDGTVITTGLYIKITVLSKQFNDMDTIIMAMGELNDIVTNEDEIKNSMKEEFGMNEFIDT